MTLMTLFFFLFRLIVMTALMNLIVPVQMETNTLKLQFYPILMPPTVYGGYLIIVQTAHFDYLFFFLFQSTVILVQSQN